MIKVVGYFWLLVLLAAIGGFVWLGLTDVPVKQQNVVIDLPVEEVIK